MGTQQGLAHCSVAVIQGGLLGHTTAKKGAGRQITTESSPNILNFIIYGGNSFFLSCFTILMFYGRTLSCITDNFLPYTAKGSNG